MSAEHHAPKVQNLVQFAQEHGLKTDHDVLSHIHAGLRSMPTSKSHARRNAQSLAKLQAERDATRVAYQAAIDAGQIIPPAPPTTEQIASGNPDLESTRAAQRLLAKRAARALAKEGT